jgi:cytochrome b561
MFPLPNLVPKDKALADVLRFTHVGLNVLLVLVICLHIAAALKHHFYDKDAVLARMLPLVKRNA